MSAHVVSLCSRFIAHFKRFSSFLFLSLPVRLLFVQFFFNFLSPPTFLTTSLSLCCKFDFHFLFFSCHFDGFNSVLVMNVLTWFYWTYWTLWIIWVMLILSKYSVVHVSYVYILEFYSVTSLSVIKDNKVNWSGYWMVEPVIRMT